MRNDDTTSVNRKSIARSAKLTECARYRDLGGPVLLEASPQDQLKQPRLSRPAHPLNGSAEPSHKRPKQCSVDRRYSGAPGIRVRNGIPFSAPDVVAFDANGVWIEVP